MSKTVFSFDPNTRAYIGAIELDDGDLSPLESTEDAPVYLIPGNCLEAEPPSPQEGQWPFAVDGQWSLRELPGEPEPEPHPEPTFEERQAALLAAVDAKLNAAARAKRYDSIQSAALRAGYPGPFHAEGLAFATWMDAVYARCYEVLAQVESGEQEEPSEAQLLAMLPELLLPT
jgi:hypothetical protein